MTGSPKKSPWYSTPKEKRKRKGIMLTLSDEAQVKLDELGEKCDSRSEAVERLILSGGASAIVDVSRSAYDLGHAEATEKARPRIAMLERAILEFLLKWRRLLPTEARQFLRNAVWRGRDARRHRRLPSIK